ncbi:heme ABC exporter ATP-binding protein CcmA [Nonomuraea rhodomycinica]|uniref:Heme ABC exporter ATP-binding protein CcmA n=1 Tax=Nonomuraea rhodomycinica TaxID=1712872 RepID=A0A7Y6INV4_9ACTN|nr:heme ABC exporter ATP-binding protein CcmA [Nonomuraea rhodomycinica]NUW40359.1 heme ABC exporter ATP-binding protein CcmA [Nonomuraea rhodomycinica]
MYEKSVVADDLHVALGGDPVLQGFSLSTAPGEIVAVVGPNGSGKSTLLRCLAGLQPVERGRVTVFGVAPADDAAFWRDVALLTDEPAWYPGLTSREHLELVEAVHGTPRMTAETALGLFELAGRADAPPQNLSTGQRQRLSLAAAFLRPSRLLLLDEPERGLDASFRVRLAELIDAYAAEGGTVVMATHDPALADRARRVSPAGQATA